VSTERTGTTTTEHAMNHVLRNLVVVAMLTMMSCATLKESTVDDSEAAASVRSVKELYEKVGLLHEQVRDLVSHVYCPNDNVRKFVQSCPRNVGMECSKDAIEDVLKVMGSFDHVMLYYRQGQAADDLLPLRRERVKRLVNDHKWTVNTQLLVVSLPMNDRSFAEAQRLGAEVHKFLRQVVLPQARPDVQPPKLLGPYDIGCSSRQEILRRYERIFGDKPFPGEPPASEKRTVVWAFLVDC